MNINKKKNIRTIVITCALLGVIIFSIHSYNEYMSRQIYNEGTSNIKASYSQVNRTFTMFAQRNWNVLSDWNVYLTRVQNNDSGMQWNDFVREKETWHYSDFYLFNEQNQYITIEGRSGVADNAKDAFNELFRFDEPVISSYISSQGVRKVLFAVPSDGITVDGITYTGLAVSYDNTEVEKMLGGEAYKDQSDCYIVDSAGNVILSIEPKTEINDMIDNLIDFIGDNATDYDTNDFHKVKTKISDGTDGCFSFTYNKKDYYMTYQPVGINDWSIVGIVEAKAVSSFMFQVQFCTIILIGIMFICVILLIFMHVLKNARLKLQREKLAVMEVSHEKEISDMLLNSMARIVDRYVLCDIENDAYEYHERQTRKLYPERGSYRDLVVEISNRYTLLSEDENKKISELLSLENIYEKIKNERDYFKFECAGKKGKVFFSMTVIPVRWEEGRLTQYLLVSQNTGEQHKMADQANKDMLTELYNKRYFESVVNMKVRSEKAFALIFLDLDYFKPVNDTYGHQAGDEVLHNVGKRILNSIRTADYAFRLGGDEFACIIDGNVDEKNCLESIDRLKKVITSPYNIHGQNIKIGVSCGYAVYPSDGDTVESILNTADSRMYSEKENHHSGRR